MTSESRSTRPRPDGVTDAEVTALGKVSEALEWVERARGRLYDFHQLSGRADLLLGDAADLLEQAGRPALAAELRREVVGRNVIAGRWTFQVVEEYDDGYWTTVREFDRRCRDHISDGVKHLFEAEMKDDRRTNGMPHHEASPDDTA
ncbi:hypothetical protein BH23ACT3_BH23ACT3_21070 [soil metagenome]